MQNTRFEYSPITTRAPLRWPDGARLAFWVATNIEYFEVDQPAASLRPVPYLPDVANYAWRDYGARVGIWRIMELLDRYAVRSSVMLNSQVCHYYPIIVEEAKRRGWEFLGHGVTNSRRLVKLSEDEERAVIHEVVTTIAAAAGTPPKGWLGPAMAETFNTPDLLAEVGIEYVCDWCNDDQPYPMRVRSNRLISVPYTNELNDLPAFLGMGVSAEQFLRMIRDQFDVLYREGARSGRVLCLALHPFILGRPTRIRYLEEALDYILGHDGVWCTTSGEIAAWYYEHYYEAPRPLA